MVNPVHPTELARWIGKNKELAGEHAEDAYVGHRKRNLPQKIRTMRESFSALSGIAWKIQMHSLNEFFFGVGMKLFLVSQV